jgi:hypothetical protein
MFFFLIAGDTPGIPKGIPLGIVKIRVLELVDRTNLSFVDVMS